MSRLHAIRRTCEHCRKPRQTTTTRKPYICDNCSVFLAVGYKRLRIQATRAVVITGIIAFAAGFIIAAVL